MKKMLLASVFVLVSNAALAATDHFLLSNVGHVHHLKITTIGEEITGSADVNFEPNPNENGRFPCSAEITGEVKKVAENELILKKQIEGEARYCSIKIHLTPNGAKLEQSEECSYYAAGICHFDSDGKELLKIK